MNFNRKLLQQQQPDSFHPILPSTLLHPIDESRPTTTTTAVAEAHQDNQTFNPNNTSFDTSMALTILVLLTALFFMSFFSFYIRRFSGDQVTHRRGSTNSSSTSTTAASRRSSSRTNKGLDPEIIKSLPTISYGGGAKHRIDCSICLSEFEEGETVKLISYCRHGFHPVCIDTWLASHVSCPLCRSTNLFGEDSVGDGMMMMMMRSMVSDDGGEGVVGPEGVRRTCSFSSVASDRLSLPRSNSF